MIILNHSRPITVFCNYFVRMTPEPSQTLNRAQRIVLNQSGLDPLKFDEVNKSSSVPEETRIPAVRRTFSPMIIRGNSYGEQIAPIE